MVLGSWRHEVFGLTVASNAPLMFASPASLGVIPDLVISLSRSPTVLSESLAEWRRRLADEQWLPAEFREIGFDDGSRFGVDLSGQRIWGWWPNSLSFEDGLTYLSGPVLGSALRLRGLQTLHASAVAVGPHAIAFVGRAGAGKSTTAAAIAKQGIPIITDDVTALRSQNSQFFVLPSYPRLNLWPDSAMALFGPDAHLPAICPGNCEWDKRFVALDNSQFGFAHQALPLSRVYVLGQRAIRQSVSKRMPPKDALSVLLANMQGVRLLDASQRARAFTDLSTLVQAVPVYEANAPLSLQEMATFADSLLRHACGGGS